MGRGEGERVEVPIEVEEGGLARAVVLVLQRAVQLLDAIIDQQSTVFSSRDTSQTIETRSSFIVYVLMSLQI